MHQYVIPLNPTQQQKYTYYDIIYNTELHTFTYYYLFILYVWMHYLLKYIYVVGVSLDTMITFLLYELKEKKKLNFKIPFFMQTFIKLLVCID